eukprot:15301-Heterococcus_DN1.PRE.2
MLAPYYKDQARAVIISGRESPGLCFYITTSTPTSHTFQFRAALQIATAATCAIASLLYLRTLTAANRSAALLRSLLTHTSVYSTMQQQLH